MRQKCALCTITIRSYQLYQLQSLILTEYYSYNVYIFNTHIRLQLANNCMFYYLLCYKYKNNKIQNKNVTNIVFNFCVIQNDNTYFILIN
jgi:hypothetical protein